MKSFDDFLSTITDADWNDMLQKAHEAISSREDSNLPTNLNDLVLMQNVMLLRRYHEWLSAQLN